MVIISVLAKIEVSFSLKQLPPTSKESWHTSFHTARWKKHVTCCMKWLVWTRNIYRGGQLYKDLPDPSRQEFSRLKTWGSVFQGGFVD